MGVPDRAPQGRAGHAKAEAGNEDSDSGLSRGKGDNAEGYTDPSCPPNLPATVLHAQLVLQPLPAPEHYPGGQSDHPVSPHPQGTPRALWVRAISWTGLTWRLLVSPWSQALLVCFCFSVEGKQGVKPSGGAGGAPSHPKSCRAQQCCPTQPPGTTASPALDSDQPRCTTHPVGPASS